MEEMKSLPACSPHYPWRKLLLFTALQRKETALAESQRQMRARERDRLKTRRLHLRRGGEGLILPCPEKSSCSPRRVFPLSIHTPDIIQTPPNVLYGIFIILAWMKPLNSGLDRKESRIFHFSWYPIYSKCPMSLWHESLYLSKENIT